MQLTSFKDFFLYLLSDIYIVECQIASQLPKMIKKAENESLKEALHEHLDETRGHVKKCEKIFKILDAEPPCADKANDIRALFVDASVFLENNHPSPLLDAAIIAFAQRVEHFEIATYGTLREYADVLESSEIKALIKECLREEERADSALTKLAKGGLFHAGINAAATLNI